jgi:pimeloyl-ACP methyl ester carboxylesterase
MGGGEECGVEEVVDGEMVLPDGRTLGYLVWGASDGHVIALCHPATGVVQPGWETASAVGARIVFPDRPGFGRSTFAPGRTILDWASDVAALMAHLGIDTFSVAGVSACTPYALACGARLAGAVNAIGVIAGTVPRAGVAAAAVASGLSPEDRQRVEAEARANAQDIPRSIARLAERPEPDGSLTAAPTCKRRSSPPPARRTAKVRRHRPRT